MIDIISSPYFPNPVSIGENELDTSLLHLLNDLARNVHEQWAQCRITDHWVYGPIRDDKKLEHPSLVPFETLSISEREYDKRTVLATIGFLIKNGYEINRIIK